MKKTSVLVACNTLTAVQLPAYADHINLTYRLGKDHPKLEFYQIQARRVSIDRFRNWVLSTAVSMNIDYILFIDDDMQLPRDTFTQLYSACRAGRWDILAALNYVRGYPFDVMGFKRESKDRLRNVTQEEVEEANGKIITCEAIGTAVCLINMKRIKNVPAPWFITGPHNTEDIYFCLKVKDTLKRARIGLHTGVITGHLLDSEVISFHTRKNLMTYYESFMDPLEVELKKNKDRGEAYVRDNVDT